MEILSDAHAGWRVKLNSTRIESIRIKGFRSLSDVKIVDLPKGATVMIGPNGSGKSNLFHFFELIKSMVVHRDLEEFVQRHGGANDQLFGGSKNSPKIEARIVLRNDDLRSECRFVLGFAHKDRLKVNEKRYRTMIATSKSNIPPSDSGGETVEPSSNSYSGVAITGMDCQDCSMEFKGFFKSCAVHQFHDTSYHSSMKKPCDIEDNFYLMPEGGNLAPVLARMERDEPERFFSIRECIRGVLPNFDRFQVEERNGKASLRWKPKGIDKTIGAHLTSDGTLRFFALATLLNLPTSMLPDTLLLDEPELGLHPAAISVIGELIRSAALDRQIVVATQSPLLVDEFDLNEILVFELRNGQTQVRRFDGADDQSRYRNWLSRYSLGELWQKNVLGGRP